MGEEYLLQESLFSQLSYVSASEAGPASRAQTQDHTPLRLILMNASWNTLLTVEAVSPSQNCPLSSHVNKWLAPQTRRSLNTFQVMLMRRPDMAALFAIGYGVADAEYTWHDLMPSPPFNASYVISWLRRAVSVAGDLQKTSSVSYQRAKNVIWTAATCRKAGVKPNTLVEVPLLGETNTCTCSRVCACIHTLLEWMILEAWALPH